jgi:exonuclease SbcC
MFESIVIRDFQAHARFALDFDPAVTVITGRSDVGKSALIRALQWVCTNQPSGEAFIRNGRKKVSVALTVDGITLRRRRGGSLNEYRFNKQTLKAFGQGKVPKPIKDFLALDDVNFQEQLDPPFWFKQSPGEVARELNQVIDLTTIDDVLARAAKNTRAAATKATAAEQRVTDAETRAHDLRWVSFMLPDFEALEVAHVAWTETSQVTSRLRVLLEDLSRAQQRADNARQRAVGAGTVLSAAKLSRSPIVRLSSGGAVPTPPESMSPTLPGPISKAGGVNLPNY